MLTTARIVQDHYSEHRLGTRYDSLIMRNGWGFLRETSWVLKPWIDFV